MQIEHLILAEALLVEDPSFGLFARELRMDLIRSKAKFIESLWGRNNSLKKHPLSLALVASLSAGHREIYCGWLRRQANKFQRKAGIRAGWLIQGRGTQGHYGGRRRERTCFPKETRHGWARNAGRLLRASDHFRDLADRIEKLPRLATID